MMLSEKDVLAICRKEIEALLHWGGSDAWNNQDFEDLSDKIAEKTSVQLSVSTLKRIWGRVKYDSQPTPATLNTLALYLGHTNWKEFRREKEIEYTKQSRNEVSEVGIPGNRSTIVEANGEVQVVVAKKRTSIFSSLVSNRSSFRTAAIILVIVPILIYFLTGFNRESNASIDSTISFDNTKLSDDLPNTVIFSYNLKGVPGDSFFIQQNWDPKRREKISPDDTKHTSIYFYPGNFTARLIVNDQIKKQSRVYIQTKGWKGIIRQTPLPSYLSADDIRLENGMGISAAVLKEKTSSPVFNEVLTQFDNVREFDSLRLGNFEFETTLQNTSTVEQSLCRRVAIEILGIGTAIIVPLADKGCASVLNVLAADTTFFGKNTDLSKLGTDFSREHRVAIKVKNRILTVSIDGEKVFERPGQKADVPIVGLRIMMEGAGVIKQVSIGNPGAPPIYAEKFQ